MAYSAGAAYVQLLPTLRGFGSSAASQINSQLANVGGPAGQRVGRDLGEGADTGLSATLTRLRGRFEEVSRSGSDSMSRLARGTAPVLDQLAKVSPVLGRVRDGFQSGQVAASAFSGAAGTVGGHLRTITDATGRVGAGFGSMATLSESALSRTGSAINRGLLAPVRGASTILAGYGLTAGTVFTGAGVAAVAMGVKFAASQEQAEMAFTTMLGSAQKAQAFVAQLQDFAAKTPFDLPSVTTGAQRLMAFGFAAKDVLPTLTAIGDAVAGMGGSAEQINQVVLAVGQMSAKGKVQGDEILQLTEAGIPALRILANQFGVTTAAMQDMISKGLVSSADAIPKLMSGIEQGTRGAAGETQAFAGMMANQATTLNGIWSNFTDNLNKALGQLVTPALPAIKSGLAVLSDGLGALPALIARFQEAARPVGAVAGAAFRDLGAFITGSVVPALRNLWTAVQPVAVIVGGALLAALRATGQLLREVVGPALVVVSGWLRPLMPVIVGIAAAFLAWYAVAAAVSAVTKAVELVRGAILAVRIAWTLLSLAFTASPIGLIIALVAGLVAGIIYAWNNFEGFRNVVLTVWEAIQTAALWAWNNALKPAFDGIVTAAQAVGSAAVWLWQNAIVPAFNAIVSAVQAVGAAANWLWQNVFSPVFNFISVVVQHVAAILFTVLIGPAILLFRALAAAVMWLWTNAVQPVFTFIGQIIAWAWNTIIKPYLDAWVWVLTQVGNGFVWLWNNAIKPAWDGLVAGISWAWTNLLKPTFDGFVWVIGQIGDFFVWLWNVAVRPAWDGLVAGVSWAWANVLRPALDGLGIAVRAVGDFFGWLWNSAVKPAWNALTGALQWAWDNVIRPVFDFFKGAVDKIGDAFKSMKDIVKGVFDSVVEFVKKPIQVVIDVVWNNGLRQVYNTAADLLPGVEPLPELRLAGGGVVPGYAPGRDVVPAVLSPGEAVLVPELVRAIGARNILAANAKAMQGRAFARGGIVARFADGGIVGAAPDPSATITPSATSLTADQAAMEATDAAAAALAATLDTVLAPALAAVELHIGTLLVQANAGLTVSTNKLRDDQAAAWTAVAATVATAGNAIAARNNTLHGQLNASWAAIAASVWASVNNQGSAFGSLQSGLTSVRGAVSLTAGWVHDRFLEMQGHAANPVRWILQWPFNAGLVAAWNRLNADFALNKAIGPVPLAFALGGSVPGAGTGDTVPAMLTPGEYVLPVDVVDRWGLDNIRSAHLAALRDDFPGLEGMFGPDLRLAQRVRGYADGGLVADTGSQVNAAVLRAQQFARQFHGRTYKWAGIGPDGFDCSGFMSAITNVLRGESPHKRRFTTASFAAGPVDGFVRGLSSAFAIGVKQGNPGHMAGTLGGVNVESGGPKNQTSYGPPAAGADSPQFTAQFSLPVVGGRFVPGGGGGVDVGQLVNDTFANTYRLIGDIGRTFPGNLMGAQGSGIATQAADRVKQFAVDKIAALYATTSASAGSPEVVAAVRAVAARFGWGTGPQWDALNWIIGRESGWNPAAANPRSSARGLFQKMTSVHGPLEATPAGQAEWGLNYIRSRYVDPVGAQRFWQQHGWYDEGGWLPPGMSTVYNGTGKPEAVFTAEQFDAISRAVDRPDQPHITVYARTDADPEHIAHSVDRHLALGARL
ncbi:hypothetical protein CFP71_21435 [Amycolatopsis thailandensis]|uniref:Tape measure protein N-terminal domain-containing protein n=1 Tax=Amycolatopsis thailandensis TaxID=589330 RepID=A0A229S4C0_9PSEU|nr:tape measure protein [Amycolatopsis thailandensis]OXM53777.1 hypothetical protein CFP71_21435 [Amycolatopsis thailandensis]